MKAETKQKFFLIWFDSSAIEIKYGFSTNCSSFLKYIEMDVYILYKPHYRESLNQASCERYNKVAVGDLSEET